MGNKTKSPYDSRIVANTFLSIAADNNKSLSNMHLQKLVFFAHGYYMALFNRPLVSDRIEAWEFGPVIKDLYHTFKSYGGKPVSAYYSTQDPNTGELVFEMVENSQDLTLIRAVFELLRNKTAIELSEITHRKDTPWAAVYHNAKGKSGPVSFEIPNSSIKTYFSELIEQGPQGVQ